MDKERAGGGAKYRESSGKQVSRSDVSGGMRNPEKNSAKVCYGCQKPGHVIAYCPTAKGPTKGKVRNVARVAVDEAVEEDDSSGEDGVHVGSVKVLDNFLVDDEKWTIGSRR